MEQLLAFWYNYGVFFGVFLAAAAAIYIFFDAQQGAAPGRATWPKILSLAGLVLTLPSLFYRLTQMDAAAVLANIFESDNNFALFFYLALLGLLLAAAALVYYFLRARDEPVAATQPLMQEPPPQAWLVVRSGPRVGTQFGLGVSRPNVIGRDPNKADIVLDEESVSREHARVRFENGQFVLHDMASTSGTYINGNNIQRQMLYDNDRITLGRVELVFKRV